MAVFLAQDHGDKLRPVVPVQGMPACLRALAACAMDSELANFLMDCAMSLPTF